MAGPLCQRRSIRRNFRGSMAVELKCMYHPSSREIRSERPTTPFFFFFFSQSPPFFAKGASQDESWRVEGSEKSRVPKALFCFVEHTTPHFKKKRLRKGTGSPVAKRNSQPPQKAKQPHNNVTAKSRKKQTRLGAAKSSSSQKYRSHCYKAAECSPQIMDSSASP